jgi:hypothetical protein
VSYELTALGAFDSLGTVGSGAASGASAGGSAGGGGASSTVSAASDAASGIVGSILTAWSDIRAQRSQQQASSASGDWASASFLDDALYGRQAEAMAREEARAQQGIQSQMGVQQARTESEIRRQTAQLRQTQVRQESSARIGTQFGRGRALPAWAWVSLGVGGIGLTLLAVWFLARRG